MPFSYEQIEDELVTRLTTSIGVAAVTIPFPDSQKEVDDALKSAESANKALICVQYAGSDFGSSNTTNQASQDDNMDLVCTVLRSKRRGLTGAMNAIYLIKLSLLGYIIANGTRLFLKSVKLTERNNETAMFMYDVTFTCRKMQVQAFLDGDDDISGDPILIKITWNGKTVNGEDISELGDFNADDYSEDFNEGIQS